MVWCLPPPRLLGRDQPALKLNLAPTPGFLTVPQARSTVAAQPQVGQRTLPPPWGRRGLAPSLRTGATQPRIPVWQYLGTDSPLPPSPHIERALTPQSRGRKIMHFVSMCIPRPSEQQPFLLLRGADCCEKSIDSQGWTYPRHFGSWSLSPFHTMKSYTSCTPHQRWQPAWV